MFTLPKNMYFYACLKFKGIYFILFFYLDKHLPCNIIPYFVIFFSWDKKGFQCGYFVADKY